MRPLYLCNPVCSDCGSGLTLLTAIHSAHPNAGVRECKAELLAHGPRGPLRRGKHTHRLIRSFTKLKYGTLLQAAAAAQLEDVKQGKKLYEDMRNFSRKYDHAFDEVDIDLLVKVSGSNSGTWTRDSSISTANQLVFITKTGGTQLPESESAASAAAAVATRMSNAAFAISGKSSGKKRSRTEMEQHGGVGEQEEEEDAEDDGMAKPPPGKRARSESQGLVSQCTA